MTDCQAIVTAKYNDKPTYPRIIVRRPDLVATKFPDDTRGKSISFADGAARCRADRARAATDRAHPS